ncbi:hypothetical protein CYFUS_001014 [Cystobacter fuscus]|uniref:Lipoprotein n=1 Tax=Cystobacter fuscus TaxID=43 RepID=A0A250IWG0_9BACT|nr:hypothetical protein [Cystobacter fuscus]ATB35600.1 hypothetical protein CYFUS_001014 [Cystobacter fuscus]
MMRGLKSLVFVAGLAFAVGCGGTELEPELDSSELGKKESALGTCPGYTSACGTGICCQYEGWNGWYCATPDAPCGDTWCHPKSKCFTVGGNSFCEVAIDCQPAT